MSEKKAWENIASQRLCLRRLQGDDAETLYFYRSSPKVNKYQCWRPESIEEVRSLLKNKLNFCLTLQIFGFSWLFATNTPAPCWEIAVSIF